MSQKVKRLYEQFHPENYNLNITLDKKALRFTGTIVITGKRVGRPSQRLTFHQKDLKVTAIKVVKRDKKGDRDISVTRTVLHKAYDEVRLHTTELLYGGSYTIELEFEGAITAAMNGIYPCHAEVDGKKEVILATQFESHHAREAFPCIDEPEAKATFDITVTGPKTDTILSNTPVKSTGEGSKTKTVTFEQTPVMSSYLVAFIVGNLKHKQAKTKNGTIVRCYATPDKVDQVDFSLDVAVKCLEFYNHYFDIPYPLEKCDMVALPDFASGAMENWGCVTYREQCMLVDEQNTSLPTKEYVAMVVAHELAHQWFGNLVTMRWWTDLWLNEGFASWIEFLAVDHIFPEWNMWTQYVAEEQQVALKLDALENTHAIEVPVKHPDEIRTIFDIISYNKGSSVIHMLNEYLGADLFRDGLRYYLKQHAHKNTDTVDLWQALETVSGKPVKTFMHEWTAEPGYPIVHATVDEKDVTLKQERFFVNRAHAPKDNSQLWPIPLLSGQATMPELLEKRKAKYQVTDEIHLKLNSHQSGFYRTIYNSSHLHKLSELIMRGKIEPLDRLGILSDAFEGAKAGYTDTDDALQLLEAFRHEDNLAVWDIIGSNIGEARLVLGEDDLREAMKPFVQKLVAPQLKRLGWEEHTNDSHFDLLLRPSILGMAAASDEESVIAECQKRYQDMKNPEDIAPDLRGVIWNTVARLGGEKEFNHFVKLHNESNNSEVRNTLAAAITGFKQPALHKKALAIIKTDDVRMQDVAYWVSYSLSNRWSRKAAWEWLKDNWEWLEKHHGSDLSFSRFPVYAARVFSTKEYLDEYKKFFEPKESPMLERAIKQGREIIEWHIDWRKRADKEALAFFKGHAKS